MEMKEPEPAASEYHITMKLVLSSSPWQFHGPT